MVKWHHVRYRDWRYTSHVVDKTTSALHPRKIGLSRPSCSSHWPAEGPTKKQHERFEAWLSSDYQRDNSHIQGTVHSTQCTVTTHPSRAILITLSPQPVSPVSQPASPISQAPLSPIHGTTAPISPIWYYHNHLKYTSTIKLSPTSPTPSL